MFQARTALPSAAHKVLPLAVAVSAALCLVAPPGARAEEDTASGLFVYGGYSRYAMGDVNDNLDQPSSLIGPITTRADHVNSGWSAGGGLRVPVSATTFLELGGSFLHASTSGSGSMLGVDYTGTLNVSAIGLTASLGALPWRIGGARAGLAAGGGYYFSDGSVSVRNATFSGSDDLEGSGPGFHAAAICQRGLGATLALDGALGYRYARTTSVKMGSDLLNQDGSKARIDWSGVFVRLGLAVYPKGLP